MPPWSAEVLEITGYDMSSAWGRSVLTGLGSRVGNALVEDPRVRAVSFTGSTAVGKRIQECAAVGLKRTQLLLTRFVFLDLAVVEFL